MRLSRLFILLGLHLPATVFSQKLSPIDSISYCLHQLNGNEISDEVNLKSVYELFARNKFDSLQFLRCNAELDSYKQKIGEDNYFFLKMVSATNLYFSGYNYGAIDAEKALIQELQLCKTPYQRYTLIWALSSLRLPYRDSDRIQEGIEFYLQKAHQYERVGDKDMTSICYYVLRGFFYTVGLLDKAIYYQQKSIQNLDTNVLYADHFVINYGPRNLGKVGYVNRLSVLASMYTEMDEPSKAFTMLQKAWNMSETFPDSIDVSDSPFIRLEMIKAQIAMNGDSVPYYLKSFESFGMQNPYFRTLYYQEKGHYFLNINQLDSAEYYLKSSLQWRDMLKLGINSYAGRIVPGYYLGQLKLKQKKYEEAIDFLQVEINRLEAINLRKVMMNELEVLTAIFKEKGDFQNALLTREKYNRIQVELLRDEASNRSMTFEVEQSIAEKERALETLAIENEFQRKSKYYMIGISSLIGLLAIGLFFGFKSKQKANKELAMKNSIISIEKEKSEGLLLNILPFEVAEELKQKGHAEAQLMDQVTVLFTDFKGFTSISEKLSPKELVFEINACFSAFDHIMSKHGVEKIKTIGDAYMAAGGLPTANRTHAADVVNAALEIQSFMRQHNHERESRNEPCFEIRIGIHTGPVVAGIVGVKKFSYDIWGDTVNTASRMESSGEVGQVNISETTYQLVHEDFLCEHRGKIQAKGKGEMDMYFVRSKANQV